MKREARALKDPRGQKETREPQGHRATKEIKAKLALRGHKAIRAKKVLMETERKVKKATKALREIQEPKV